MTIEQIKQNITSTLPFHKLAVRLRECSAHNSITMNGIHGSLMAFVVSHVFNEHQRQVVMIVPDKDSAEQLRDDCTSLLGDEHVCFYATHPAHGSVQLDMSVPIAQLETLRTLSQGESILIIATVESLTEKLPSPKEFLSRTIEISTKSDYAFELLVEQLRELGFEKKDFVEEYGDYAVRGGILDVFPFSGEHPIRLEFWGDSVESMREFDVLSQCSLRELEKITIIGDLHLEPVQEIQHSTTDHDHGKIASLFDYLQTNALLIIDEPVFCQKEVEELHEDGYQNIFNWAEIRQRIINCVHVTHTHLEAHQSEDDVNFSSHPQSSIAGSVKRLLEQISEFNRKHYTVYISCDTTSEADRLEELIEEELTSPNINSVSDGGSLKQPDVRTELLNSNSQFSCQYEFIYENLHSGFSFDPAQIAVFTEHEIFGRLKRRGTAKRRKFKGISQKELYQLQRGDFVVHQDYGIGKFVGLQRISLHGSETEVMKLLYDANDTVYVNLNFINRVQKYSSREGHTPSLQRLGGSEWEKLKTRARKKIKDIARDLIKLYALRKHEQGFSFAPDTHWQKEMEASFMYEDTPDQAKSTTDVKQDMENSSPMDRLICGDVGFGKTEVAVRAAFKAVMNGKQVAVLVPTTILAYQHFRTFLDRLERYSVHVESLSRFKTKKEQSKILDSVQSGSIDIIIGTHRLLSKDVAFKDLGLLIIDEEHRFGVAAKEKLRQLKATVDTLTLTATPIPRTLQFSLMGARDLSLINTPPRNRLPIETEIAQFDNQLIHEAIMKEIHRGGQVYFVHDRVQNIEIVRNSLEANIPKARFRVAHGQMKGHQLEQTMLDFLDKKFDVLICTKIIESGIDIPSVNTIIINRADRFGMAELYQLRGRVGRSNIQAYAYLLTPPLSVLPRQTLRRLQAIREFTELGSGFNLAMRDLEIRGTGNLLGREQSGFILEMGFEMYQRVVEDAVRELKEEEFKEFVKEEHARAQQKPETIVETDIQALIPEIYIEHDGERLDIYRRLYRCTSTTEIDSLRNELQDRFGEYPIEVENLFRLIELKILAAAIGFTKLELDGEELVLFFPAAESTIFYEGENAPFQILMERIHHTGTFHPHLRQEGKQLKLIANFPLTHETQHRLDAIKIFLVGLQEKNPTLLNA